MAVVINGAPRPAALAAMLAAIMILLVGAHPSQAQARRPASAAVTLPTAAPWVGDFDGMLRRRMVRILTPFSQTDYFLDRGKQMGVSAEYGRALEEWLNRRHARSHLKLHVIIVPTPRDKLMDSLRNGRGDIVVANLTVTPERQAAADFTNPILTNVREIVVTGPASPRIGSLEDLAGLSIPLRPSSSYAAHVARLSQTFSAAGRPAIGAAPLSEALEDEKILAMVSAGLLPLAVVDAHKAKLWTGVLPGLVMREDLAVNEGGDIAWAARKGSPKLLDELNAFLQDHRGGTSFGNTVHRRYFGGRKIVRPAALQEELQKLDRLLASFRKHGGDAGIDALLLAAQGYQESQLVQERRSRAGAVGVMQLLPRTAAAPPIAVENVAQDADANIMAGARYMRHLMDRYVNDAGPDALNRTLLTFAAYNAGPGNLRKFRREAANMGLDPNVWLNNVEQGAAKVVGRETVQYVANIYKYFVAYDLLRRDFAPGEARTGR
jgi:membrane-bound lytic murein transglycosylase MltF